ncbi:hypothetical protein BGW38_001196 [Lunasporangiospora selenospora]|uniref:Uncharacterized protein n=1 Tax=Lunasporangiospora selenospora TaxID=979761 RepID=A0A9P6FVY0_9FUNG|nr:hypothetical protein BGW38_001196 [Lunasporangiospora selenospora]
MTNIARESSGLKAKIMRLGQVAILVTLISTAKASCTVNTSTNIDYQPGNTLTSYTRITFSTPTTISNPLENVFKCPGVGKFKYCDSTNSFCATVKCSQDNVTLVDHTYRGIVLGSDITEPSHRDRYPYNRVIDEYWSCY